MTDIINHPAHYTGVTAEIECIDIARHLNFQLGNAFKYVWRAISMHSISAVTPV